MVKPYRKTSKGTHKTPHVFDLCKWRTKLRKDERAAQYPVKAQRSIIFRVTRAYKNYFDDKKAGRRVGLPRLNKTVRSCNLECVKPGKSGKSGRYWSVQVKEIGKLRLKVLAGSNAGMQFCILRHPLDTGYDVQLVVQHAVVSVVEESRAAVGIDVGVDANTPRCPTVRRMIG